MMNRMDLDGYQAVIRYALKIELFRVEFIGLNGGTDFYAADIAGPKQKGVPFLACRITLIPD